MKNYKCIVVIKDKLVEYSKLNKNYSNKCVIQFLSSLAYSKVILLFILFWFIVFLFKPTEIFARNYSTDCSNRYVTFVNPMRSRALWQDHSLMPFIDQKTALEQYNYSATWLIQYDILNDSELTEELKKLTKSHEIGVLLEVSENHADSSKVFFDSNSAWFSPKVVFLSAYERSERERLIDELYSKFYEVYGAYPSSVGAWWIDSYSVEYIKQKYGLKSIMIVADQLSTDKYGVWGQWWGVPFYPSKGNLLVPASNLDNKFDTVVIQWAQRHAEKSYGDTPAYSNYSLQANDYIRLNQTHQHFIDLVNYYLSCDLPLGQITIGLETGQESVPFIEEYKNQIKSLAEIKNLKSVTMNEFSENFKVVYPGIISNLLLESNQSSWELSIFGRKNEFLNDSVKYKAVSFSDYFKADRSDFLDRNLNHLEVETREYFPYYLLAFLFFAILFFVKNLFSYFISLSLLFFAFFGLFYKSNISFGWEIYFGPIISNLSSMQLLLIVLYFTCSYWIVRMQNYNYNRIILGILLSFGIEGFISLLRYTVFDGKKIIALSIDSFNLFGISFTNNIPGIFIQTFPARTADAIYSFPFERLYENGFYYFAILPLFHILIGFGIYLLLKKMPKKVRYICIVLLGLLTAYYIFSIIYSDPLKVIATR